MAEVSVAEVKRDLAYGARTSATNRSQPCFRTVRRPRVNLVSARQYAGKIGREKYI